jgi:hypothetical protein
MKRAARRVANLSGADVDRDFLRTSRGVDRAESRAPGVAQDRDLLRPEAPAHEVDELVEIGDELIQRHRGSGNVAIERLAGAALIPMDDGEVSLERRVEVAEEAHLTHARTAVQNDQRRIGDVLSADHHPLIDSAETYVLGLRDAVREDVAICPAEGFGVAKMGIARAVPVPPAPLHDFFKAVRESGSALGAACASPPFWRLPISGKRVGRGRIRRRPRRCFRDFRHPARRIDVIPAKQCCRGISTRGGSMAFELSAHMTVRPGQLEGFKKQAAECIRITKEKDTHTLRYDWFLSSDGECEVREAYSGPEGLIEHNHHILEARTKLFKDYADNHFMTFYSEPVPELVDLAKKLHMENQFKWFSFVKGLDSSSS